MMAPAWSSDFAPAPPSLGPDDVNVLHPYVADQETYDTNLFRIPTNTAGSLSTILPNATRADYLNTATLGLVAQYELGRQAVSLAVRADQNWFKNNTALNFTSANADVVWDWRLGGYFSGTAQVIYDRDLASFGETRFDGKDIVSSVEGLLSGRYQVGPHWAAYGDVRGSNTNHSAQAAQYNDFHNASGDAAVEYATDVNDVFTAKYSYVKVTFSNFAFVSTTPSDYTEDAERLAVKYALTDKTSIDAYGGYLKRTYPGTNFGSYSGLIGRLAFRWQVTDKTQVLLSGWHELHAYIDNESDYFKANGFSLGPQWDATEKLRFLMVLQQENQNYVGTNANVVTPVASPIDVTFGARQAKVYAGQFTGIYTPRNPVSIVFFLRHEQRTSDQYSFTYTDNLASLSASYKFR